MKMCREQRVVKASGGSRNACAANAVSAANATGAARRAAQKRAGFQLERFGTATALQAKYEVPMSSKPYVIVVGTDYSTHAEKALRAAYEQARRCAPAELHVCHVSLASAAVGAELAAPGPFPVAFGGLGALPVLSLDEQKAQLVKYLDQLIATLPDFRDAQVRVFAHVLLDAPTFGVTGLASTLEANLIVVGSHGRHGVARWLLGSVAEAVVRQANCPVLVVPPEPEALKVPSIEPPCPDCVATRKSSANQELWCERHREHHGRRHTYHQNDRVGAETNLPLVMR
jgi:nucleotide-binding universal stress UspA family protein